MIIVTGPGRSGTSLVAQIYRGLGFDPGGGWNPQVRAGLESREIVLMNERIADALGMVVFWSRRSMRKSLRRATRILPPGARRYVLDRFTKPMRRPRPFSPPRWERLLEVADRYGTELRDLSRAREVVKDPRFCWTLPVWAEAGADIEHVLVCVRDLNAMVRSRIAAGHAKPSAEAPVRDSLMYSLSLCTVSLHDYGLEHAFVRFPDFVHNPIELYEAMRFPRPISRDAFMKTFAAIARRDDVRNGPVSQDIVDRY